MRGWMTVGVLGAVVLAGHVCGQTPPVEAASPARGDAPASLDEAMQDGERQREQWKMEALRAIAGGDAMGAIVVVDQAMDVLPDDAELMEALETLRGPAVEAALRRARRMGEMGRHGAAMEMLAPVYVATGDERLGAALKEARFWSGVAREVQGEGRREGNVIRGADEGELRRVMGEVERVMARLDRLEEKFTFSGRAEPAVDELRRAVEDTRRDVERMSVEIRREMESMSREVMSLRREVDRLRR